MKKKFYFLVLLLLCTPLLQVVVQTDSFFYENYSDDTRAMGVFGCFGLTNMEVETVPVPLHGGLFVLLLCGLFYVVLRKKEVCYEKN